MFSILKRLLGRKSRNRQLAEELALEDDLEWLYPPTNMHSASAWDRYWRDQVSHGLNPELFDMFLSDDSLIRVMSEHGMRTVLCAGNGISQEPRVLAAAGFEVTALDISPVALQLAQRAGPATDSAQPGKVKFVVGNLLNPRICARPFDVVIERRTLQVFPENERSVALDALLARLGPQGMILSHCHDARWRPPAAPTHVTISLLLERDLAIWSGGPNPKPTGRVAWLQTSTG
jgi:SAM-dependent methyltransferase